jgi:aldose 1-epimerase
VTRSRAAYPANPLDDPSAVVLAAGDMEAVFLPHHGMLGISLRFRGTEILRHLEDLKASAATGAVVGLPFLYPWANRLAGFSYEAAGRKVTLDSKLPLLDFDANGLPMHGIPWPHLSWTGIQTEPGRLAAELYWSRADCLAIFPYRHRLTMTVVLGSDSLTMETVVIAGADTVPVTFGFHPYIGLSDLRREDWHVTLPAMRHLVLDQHMIPTGAEEDYAGLDGGLGQRTFDDSFALLDDRATFSLSGAGLRIAVEMLEGYQYAQVYAPKGKAYMAFEPMTAPTNALISGRGLRLVEPKGRFRAVFRFRVSSEA